MFEKFKELRENNENGFTLIELLVVILIIGILAAIAIPVFMNQRKTAIDGTVESDVKNASLAVETWAIANKSAGVPIDINVLRSQYGLKNSEGVTLSVVGTNTDGYCITGYHENGKNYVSTIQAATYDSMAGGLHKDGGVCAGGINNEDGNGIEVPTASAISMKNGSGVTKQLQATAQWNSYGGATVNFATDADVSGSLELSYRFYCGTTPSGGGMGGAWFQSGVGSVSSYYTPNDCGVVDGISVSNGQFAGEWTLEAESPIIPIVGSVPQAPAPDPNGGQPGGGGYEQTYEAMTRSYSDVSMTGADSRYATMNINIDRTTDGNVTINGTMTAGYGNWPGDGTDASGLMSLSFSQFSADIVVNADGTFSYFGDGKGITYIDGAEKSVVLNFNDATQVTGVFTD